VPSGGGECYAQPISFLQKHSVKMNRNYLRKLNILTFVFMLSPLLLSGQGLLKTEDKVSQTDAPKSTLTNIPGRKTTSLNGKWKAIIDPYDYGINFWSAIWKDKVASGKTDFYEYSFDNGPVLDVPGDFNSQRPELYYFEGTVWYKKTFSYHKNIQKRLFLHFGAVSYQADVFLNSIKIGSHEGSFTAFQFDITSQAKEGDNTILVRVNNQRRSDGIPALGFDWFNYGGITRDVNLVETAESYVDDYFIQLKKGSTKQVEGWVKLSGSKAEQLVNIQIPEAGISYKVKTGGDGKANISFPAKLQLWMPGWPKLYQVRICSATDTVTEAIGFRTIETHGTDILLNGKPVFLKGVSFHEEIPQRKGRAYSETDALQLLSWAKELGCNFIRLAHYPQNEHTVRLAEKLGLMMWEEIPVYQGVAFGDPKMQHKMNGMLQEMISRDKNRCGIVIWSMSNETSPGNDRNAAIINMARLSRAMDPTRLISSAFNDVKYAGNTVTIDDTLSRALDVLAVNEYIGWYTAWAAQPGTSKWSSAFNKPLIMSEFGAEALYGNHGAADVASSWSEEYQEQFYKDQTAMFKNIPFLRGTCPWILVDFLSPRRMHPVYQDGWNRKGLLSDKGFRKKAWYVMEKYYKDIQ
jgi:beta-glucuronidase